jgi:arylformamidase
VIDPTSMDRDHLDAEYSPSRLVSSIDRYLEAYRTDSVTVKKRYVQFLQSDMKYGSSDEEVLDLFVPDNARALHLFIHGGFWQALSKDDSAFPAPPCLDQNIAFAALNYTLAPAANLTRIFAQIARAIVWLYREADRYSYPRTVVLSGHSAGAQLAAMMLTVDWEAEYDLPNDFIKGAMLISGVYDLEPISRCYVNDALRLTTSEIRELSPVNLRCLNAHPVCIVYGDNETNAFKRQSQRLFETWADPSTQVEIQPIEERNHFDLVQDLGHERSLISQMLIDWAS